MTMYNILTSSYGVPAKDCFIDYHSIHTYGRMAYALYTFLILVCFSLKKDNPCQLSHSGSLTVLLEHYIYACSIFEV